MIGLKRLVKGTSPVSTKGISLKINGLTDDSRKVKPGNLFLAYEGVDVDGHSFIPEAIKRGAVAVVGEKPLKLSVSYVQVKDGRLALAQMWSNWYDNPEKKLKVIGVTGTDGKTTTATLIYELLKAAGLKPGLISTVAARVGDTNLDTGFHTTSPDQDIFYGLLKKMVQAHCRYAIAEVTSHALAQKRYGNLNYEFGVLTNLAHDHLDYHGTLKNYRDAKGILFTQSKTSILNRKSLGYSYFRKVSRGQSFTYDRTKEIKDVGYLTHGSKVIQHFKVRYSGKWLDLKTRLLGDYNQENILAALKVAERLHLSPGLVQKTIATFRPPQGRFQVIPNNRHLHVIVDFGHTEQGIAAILSLVRKHLMKEKERSIAVFGANGQRDRTKRPGMGHVASKLADFVVITHEDPRNEDPGQIYEDIARGCRKGRGVLDKSYFRLDDRTRAINFALNKLARPGDWIVILGKGHEQSMNIKGTEYPWSDIKVTKQILNGKIKKNGITRKGRGVSYN